MDTTHQHAVRSLLGWLPLGLCLALGALALGLTAQGEMPQGEPGSPGTRHVVLRNGQILTGAVTDLGDRTQILLPHGGEISLPTKEVLLACRTLHEAYAHLAERIHDRQTATPHIELARWCLRHELLREAADQLALARELDRKHTSLAVLERQLDHLRRAAATPATLTPPANATPLSPYDSMASRIPSRNTESRGNHPPTMEELEETMRSIPKEGVEMFVNTIQPIMWNKCGTNRCHDVGGPTEFRVLRPANGSHVWRRLSLRNLHTALNYVDRNDPDSSPLVTASRDAHADLSVGALGGEESLQYQQLLIWVRGIYGRRYSTEPAPLASTQPNSGGRTGSADPAVARASFESPVAPNITEPETGNAEERSRPGSGPSASPKENSPYEPRDPFDPEVFNRRYLRR